MKLAPMLGRDDLESLFVAEGADESRLPWSQAGLFSAACSTTSINPYCDVIASFDDPNCLNCEGDDLAPRPPFGWLPGRGLDAWKRAHQLHAGELPVGVRRALQEGLSSSSGGPRLGGLR